MPARKTTRKSRVTRTASNSKRQTTSRRTSKATNKTSSSRTKKRAQKDSDFSFPATAIKSKQTKSQIINEISELTEVSKKEVRTVFAALKNVIERHVKPKGSGEISIPELGIKVRRVQKKATKARMGRNPFTGEEIKIPAKPARKSVKVSALKQLKELIEA